MVQSFLWTQRTVKAVISQLKGNQVKKVNKKKNLSWLPWSRVSEKCATNKRDLIPRNRKIFPRLHSQYWPSWWRKNRTTKNCHPCVLWESTHLLPFLLLKNIPLCCFLIGFFSCFIETILGSLLFNIARENPVLPLNLRAYVHGL